LSFPSASSAASVSSFGGFCIAGCCFGLGHIGSICLDALGLGDRVTVVMIVVVVVVVVMIVIRDYDRARRPSRPSPNGCGDALTAGLSCGATTADAAMAASRSRVLRLAE